MIRETAKEFFTAISEGLTEQEIELLDSLCEKLCQGAKEAIRQK